MIVSSAMHALYMRKCSTSKGAKKKLISSEPEKKKKSWGEQGCVCLFVFLYTVAARVKIGKISSFQSR